MRNVWLGIDPGLQTTGVGLVGDIESGRLHPRPRLVVSAAVKGKTASQDLVARTADMADMVFYTLNRMLEEDFTGVRRVICCCIEQPFIGVNSRTGLMTYGLYAVLCDRLWRADAGKIIPVNPSTLKKFMGAKAKAHVMARARRMFGFMQSSHDAVDALCLAMYAYQRDGMA